MGIEIIYKLNPPQVVRYRRTICDSFLIHDKQNCRYFFSPKFFRIKKLKSFPIIDFGMLVDSYNKYTYYNRKTLILVKKNKGRFF